MRVTITAVRPFHVTMMANALRPHTAGIQILSSAPRRFFGKLDPAVQTRLIPSPYDVLGRLVRLPERFSMHGLVVWDRAVAAMLPAGADLVIGLATQSLHTGEAARRRGMRFALDRACPHVDFQQELVREESAKLGVPFHAQPAWMRDRQIAEYALAEVILAPSDYTARSFPQSLRSKVVIAPLMGRASAKGEVRLARNTPFTVGVLGGQPVRKGYLYLLQAWKKLALPNARLRIRSSSDLREFPRLAELLRELPSVELVDYIPNIAEFYQGCDAFVLPSVDDGFGMALFEAMANAVPSVATTHCGASELLTDGVDGLVIPPRDPDAIAAALLRLYEDEALRQSIALAGQATVERVTGTRLYEAALTGALLGHAPPAQPPAPLLQHA